VHLLYWAGFVAYSILVIIIGWRGYRRAGRSSDPDMDFWAASRNLGPGAAGLSISASFMSISWSCVYAVQLFYWYGVSGLWLVPIPWLLTMLGFYLLVPRFRSLPAFSQPEMVAHRFGESLRKTIALPLAFVFLVWGGAEIFAAARVLSPLLQAPFHLVLALVALVVASYSYLGGFAAVVTTDKVQYALVALFIATIAWLGLEAATAGQSIAAVTRHLPPPPKANGSALSLFAVGPALIFMTLFAYLPGWLVETDVWLRLQAARSTRAARQGVIIAAVNSLLFLAVLPMLIGLAALILYPPVAGVIPAELEDGAAIFALLMRDHAPLWLGVLLSIGLAAAAMSTVDTCGNVVAISLSYDILERHAISRRLQWDRQRLARAMSAGAILLAYVYALFTDSLWDIFYLSSGILTTTIFLPMLAIFLPKATAAQARNAAIAGFIGTLVFYFLESRGWLAALEPAWLAETGLGYILWGFAASVVGFAVGRRR